MLCFFKWYSDFCLSLKSLLINMYKIQKYLSVFFVWVYTIGFAQDFQFTAKASKSTLGLNQRVRVEYSVNQNGTDHFKAPDFKGFKVVAGPSTSVSQSYINGKSSYSQSYSYFLQPTSKGSFTLPGASITLQGKEYKSNSLTFTVTDNVDEAKDPNDPTTAAQQNIFLAAHISKENPYVGEGIYVEYRLYFSNRIEFYNPQFGEMPKYEGFWNQEIPITNYDRQIGDYKGEKLNFFTLKKTVLIPQKSGKLTIDPIEIDVIVGVPTGKYDFFGYPLIQKVNQHYTSGTRSIQIKPLPENGKPEDFTGAVGDYTLSVKASKNTLGANESSQVNVSINGTGNFKLFDLPTLKVPAELEVYTPERKENLSTTLSGLNGNISESYAIVANYMGKYLIPPVTFSYFNPKDGKYHSLSSEEIVLEVTGGSSTDTTHTPISHKQKVQSKGGDFRHIHAETELNPIQKKDFYGSLAYYSLLGLPYLAIPFFILIGKKRKEREADTVGNKLRAAEKMTKKYLSEAGKHLGNKDLFYEALEKALHNFLKAKLNIETSDISQEKISTLLREKGVSDMAIHNFIELLNDCNFARFTPMVRSAMEAELNKAAQVILKINTELK